MCKKETYKLIQNSLGGRILEYSLVEENMLSKKDTFYGIKLTLKSKKINEEVIINRISKEKTVVKNLLEYLYENSIDTIHFKDIVDDYMSLIN